MTAYSVRLLVVDDSELSREFLARRLARKGFETETAESGSKALAFIEQTKVDLVLLDVQMPDMSGLEVLRRIRKTYPPERLPVVMVTGSEEDRDVSEALHLGANAYVLKHVDLQSIVTTIHSLIPARNPSADEISDSAKQRR